MNEKGLRKQKSSDRKRYLLIAGIVAAVAVLAVLLGTTLADEPPRIISVGAQPNTVIPSGTCQIVCHAIDPDGDKAGLSYDWRASRGKIDGTGATVNWTAPASLGSHNVTVTVTDVRGGEDTKETTIMVITGNPPIITGLIANAVWATALGSLQVTCAASDPDGDELSYQWWANGGDISGTGAVANWTTPQEVGTYNITVVVRDSHGGSATDSLSISVTTGQPPKIEALLVTAEHCYLKEYSWGYKVGKGQKYHIECVVSNMSEPVYDWSCDGGEISGEGPVITWTAQNESVDVTVTVVVSDVLGNVVGRGVALEVVDCSPCTFGC